MEGLRPCPFCGRSDTMCFSNNHEECDDDIDVPTMYIVVCSMHDGGCGAHSGYYETKREAAAAWNRRVERTCTVESSYPAWGEDDMWYEIELSCGDSFPWWESYPPDYCPYCGAKVVSK